MKMTRLHSWASSGLPFIWINAGAVAVSLIMVIAVVLILSINGLGHFWPGKVMRASYLPPYGREADSASEFIGQPLQTEIVSAEQLTASGFDLAAYPDAAAAAWQRQLIKFGNRDLTGSDFGWVVTEFVSDIEYPEQMAVLERRSWGNFYGILEALLVQGEEVSPPAIDQQSHDLLWLEFQQRLSRVAELYSRIDRLEKQELARLNQQAERLRRQRKRFEMQNDLWGQSPEVIESVGPELSAVLMAITRQQHVLETRYTDYQTEISGLYEQASRDAARFVAANDQRVEIPLAEIVRAYRPNRLGSGEKLGMYWHKLGEFLSSEPREANTEGGIFPAIVGTVVLVLLMTVFVAPFGVIAAIYLHEYARQGLATRLIRIAVNNLAGVPSIVYGMFGLGFFIYLVGGEIDRRVYAETLPAPTFGTPGILWASLTLALLTMPVVIVATEEGLARIPRSLREGSLALGATRFETITRVVFPVASPAMLTGLILAIARAAGEVAPLMLVGAVKLAPALPVNGIYPYIHLDQKFMHLGYHIYDMAFQSPNSDAARPLVFATALLLVVVIALLNFSAAALRNRLQQKYQAYRPVDMNRTGMAAADLR